MNFVNAFIIGGLFCALGEILILKTKLTPARILVGYVISGIILSGFGIYQPLLNFAGAGASIPLTGFGHLLAAGVREEVNEIGLIGCISGGIGACSCGLGAAILFAFLTSICFYSKPDYKRKNHDFSIYKNKK